MKMEEKNQLSQLYPDGIKFLLTGVGGQGTILASNVLADLGLSLGFDVKKAEIHGMSQRGGTVTSYIRWAEKVFSPIISKGEADIIIAFEKLEAIRAIDQLKQDGIILINDYAIVPVTVSSGSGKYPTNEEIKEKIHLLTKRDYWVPGMQIAEELGNAKVSNVAILGALSQLLGIDKEAFLKVISSKIPEKYRSLNELSFIQGWESVLKM
jgi:indolepyruvate ferredoxin oxidoreductase beta subunit